MSIYIGYVYTDDDNPVHIMFNAIYKVYIMNPVQAIVKARLHKEAIRNARIDMAIVETTAAILIALAESVEYQLQLTHFMDFFPTKQYADIEGINWNQVISSELSTISGITHWVSDDVYVISSSANNLIEADLSKYFN